MRKLFRNMAVLMVTSTLLTAGQANAQEQQAIGDRSLSPRFGAKAGLNLSNFYNDDINDNNLRAGLQAGLYAKLPVTRGLSIQPELLYSSKGSKRSYDNILFGEG